MGKFTYIILDCVFFLPPIYFVLRHYTHHVRKYFKLLLVTILFSGIFYFLVDPLAAYWGAWNYHFEKTLGIRIGDSVIETFFWSLFIAVLFGLLVGVLADNEDKKESLRSLFLIPFFCKPRDRKI